MQDFGANGWNEWKRRVLFQLEEQSKSMQLLHNDITKVKLEIAMLKVKAGIWGAMGASIPVGVAIVYQLLSK